MRLTASWAVARSAPQVYLAPAAPEDPLACRERRERLVSTERTGSTAIRACQGLKVPKERGDRSEERKEIGEIEDSPDLPVQKVSLVFPGNRDCLGLS